MKRVLIIEDRPARQRNMFGEDSVAKLESMNNVETRESLPEDYSTFDIIAIHKSYMDRDALSSKLYTFLDDKSKRLIVFSGGNYRQNIIYGGQILVLSAKEFYSKNLIPFLEQLSADDTGPVILGKLIYGINNWELPVLAKIRNLEWLLKDDEDNFLLEDQIADLRKSIGLNQMEDVNNQIMDRLGL